MANTAVKKSSNSKRLTYLITGDGTGAALTLAAATLAGDLAAGPLKDALSKTYATQAAARTATLEGPVKVFVRQQALPTYAAATVAGAIAPDGAMTAVGVTATNAVNPANAAYTLADQTTIAALANAIKVDHNALLADVTALRTVVNNLVADHNLGATDIKAIVPELQQFSADVDLDAGAGSAPKIVLAMPAKACSFYLDVVYSWSASGA